MNKSFEQLPTWPRERNLATYAKYTNIKFEEMLADDKTWIDIGCRTGIALHESQTFCKAKLLGVNSHTIEVLPGITSVYCELPQNRLVYSNYGKKIDLLTDVYGAFSYSNDPLEVLLYEACLLRDKATAVIISLEARLGNRANWQDIKSFFASNLGQEIDFQRFRSYTDHLKRPLNSLRITIRGQNSSGCSLDELYTQATHFVGRAKKVRIAYRPSDNSCELWKIIYKKG